MVKDRRSLLEGRKPWRIRIGPQPQDIDRCARGMPEYAFRLLQRPVAAKVLGDTSGYAVHSTQFTARGAKNGLGRTEVPQQLAKNFCSYRRYAAEGHGVEFLRWHIRYSSHERLATEEIREGAEVKVRWRGCDKIQFYHNLWCDEVENSLPYRSDFGMAY